MDLIKKVDLEEVYDVFKQVKTQFNLISSFRFNT